MRRLLISAALSAIVASQASAEVCTLLLRDLSFCHAGQWQEVGANLPEGMKVWTAEPDVTAKLMAQPVTGLLAESPEVVLAALKTSVRASQEDPGSVTFKEHHIFDGSHFEHGIISYELIVNSQPVLVHHSFMLADTVVLQFVTHGRSADDAENLEFHRDFVTSFKVIEDQQDA